LLSNKVDVLDNQWRTQEFWVQSQLRIKKFQIESYSPVLYTSM